jgi:tetratricopeptide (TPR) repeat protein
MMQHQRRNPIAHAAALNNIAAAYLHVGDYGTAVAQFTMALKAVKKYNVAANNKGFVDARKKMENLTSLDNCILHSYPEGAHTDKRECSYDHHENGQEEPISFLYRHAILLPSRAFESSIGDGKHDDYSAYIITSVATLFNLALAHHLAAIHQEAQGDQRSSERAKLQLDKAVKLYQLAITCSEDRDTTSTWDGFLLFAMATTNNMAMALKMLQQNELSREFALELLSLVILLVDLGNLKTTVVSFCCGFFQNTYHLVGQQITAVAA